MISLRRWVKKLAAKKEAKEQSAPTLTGRRNRGLTASLYNPADMAKLVTKTKPFFKMYRGVYAVAVNKKGEGIYFIRMDKARGMGKKRKRERQLARRLASASISL
jgi:hypothetical protein